MNFTPLHIGKTIQRVVHDRRLSGTWLGQKLGISGKNARLIFKRSEIRSAQLRQISLVLEQDFFVEFLSDENKALLAEGKAARANVNALASPPSVESQSETERLREENRLLRELNELLRQKVQASNPG